jgi:tetratricopeptide (TPR) repeat protein
MRKLPLFILVVALCILHFFALGKATNAAGAFSKSEDITFVLPTPILKITTLEFDGLASDFLFLKSTSFLGSTFERKERPRVKEWEWRWLDNVLNASAGLDPYFFDPYYFANAHLTWEGGLVRETDKLLEKGSRVRDWDWRLPFYLGFNEFYFLNENEEASKWLMEASRRPGGSPMLASLASKLAFKEGRTENAIIFLEEITKKTDDKELKKYYEKRLKALRDIDLLEKAVGNYRERFRITPRSLDELSTKGIISEIPKEPFGGRYYLAEDGTPKTTNEDELMPIIKNRQ